LHAVLPGDVEIATVAGHELAVGVARYDQSLGNEQANRNDQP
jgi:hypothetical protein